MPKPLQNKIEIAYRISTFKDLNASDRQLVKLAKDAMTKAHAPYSNFQVGAAVWLADGSIITGNNQENAAYPSGLCAERVALFSAMSHGIQPIKAIAVVATDRKKNPADAFCCGGCRQVIMEYASLQMPEKIEIIMQTSAGQFILLDDARNLLPFQFDASTLQ